MSFYREQLENYVKRIDVKADKVLDIGGGQLHINKRVNSWDVKSYEILDNDEQYSPNYNLDVNYSWTEKEIKRKFNMVFCLEVAEYVFDPVTFHKNIAFVLEIGGIAYISYPTIYPLHNPPGIDYLRYTKNAIETYLQISGFSDWSITPRVATYGLENLSMFYSQEGMRAMKGTRDIFDIGYLVKAVK